MPIGSIAVPAGPAATSTREIFHMPLEREQKSALRDRVSTANKRNVDEIADEVRAALAGLADDDKDHARLTGWLDDLATVKGGGNPGRF
jgi:hypothetical protein